MWTFRLLLLLLLLYLDSSLLLSKCFNPLKMFSTNNVNNQVRELSELVLRTKDATSFPMVIVGNKKDLEHERKVTEGDGEGLAKELGCPFFETSAKTRLNVDDCFTALVREIWSASGENPRDLADKKEKKKGCVLL